MQRVVHVYVGRPLCSTSFGHVDNAGSEATNAWTLEWHHIHRIIEFPLYAFYPLSSDYADPCRSEPHHTEWHEWDRERRPNYLPLSDEELGFFYDPEKVLYQSVTRTGDGRPISESPASSSWECANNVQFVCQGCRVQQLRCFPLSGLAGLSSADRPGVISMARTTLSRPTVSSSAMASRRLHFRLRRSPEHGSQSDQSLVRRGSSNWRCS